MCINVVLDHVELRSLIIRLRELLAEHGMKDAEWSELQDAIATIEMDLQREVMALRRKAWDEAISKLPPEAVQKLEDHFGFGWLKKPQ